MKKIIKWLAIPLIIVLIAGGLLGYNYYQARAQQVNLSNVQTVKAATGNIATYVDATGSVRTNQSGVLTWQASGIAGKINVKAGDQVKTGQVLASLDPNYLPSNIISAQSDLVTAQEALQNLQQSSTTQAQAGVAAIQAQATLTATINTQQNLNSLTSSQPYLNAVYELQQAQGLVKQLRNQYQAMADNSPTKSQTKFALSMAIQKANRAQNLVDLYGGDPTPQQLALAQANVALAQAQLADAERQANLLKNGPSSQDLAAAEAKVMAAQATLNQVNVVAPFNGTVTQVNSQVGDVVKSGDTAFQIDDVSGLFIDLQVSEVDINKVQVGQPATVTLDAVSGKTYNAKVTDIGVVGTTTNGAVYYNVTIQLTDADAQVKPGMTASASIVVDKKTGVLLVPSTAIKTVNNRSYVEIINNGQLRRVFIQTGMTTDTQTEVTGGSLQVGEEVAINPPTVTSRATGLGGIFRIFGGGGGTGGNFRTGGGGNFSGGNGGNFSVGNRGTGTNGAGSGSNGGGNGGRSGGNP